MTAPLERISLKKGRRHAPRLSQPYVPGRHSERFWREDEIAIVERHYETRGAGYCAGLLPRHGVRAVYNRAHALGLSRRGRQVRKLERHYRAGIDDQIRAAWPELRGRGAVLALSRRLGVPRWWLSKRATALGLTMPHKKEPPWTKAEEQLLRKVPLHAPDVAARVFREHGFARSPAAIMIRAHRCDLSRRWTATLSATAVAKILGVDGKTVTVWLLKGWLKAVKRPTRRLAQQGGDPWSVERAELRRFIAENPERIDLRKVDKLAFVELLVGPTEPPNGRAGAPKRPQR